MNTYAIAPAARDDLGEIADYIARGSPAAAHRVVDAIFETFASLAARPGIGHLRGDLTSQPVRFWTVLGRYLIVYRERPAGIDVVRVLGPGRDVAAILR